MAAKAAGVRPESEDPAMIELVINPTAGTGHAESVGKQMIDLLEKKQAEFHVSFTTRAGEGEPLARDAAAHGAETVFAVGGDGTVLEVARGLRDTGAALGIIPAGTGNDVIKTLGIPKDPVEALEYQLARPVRPLDAMTVNGKLSLNIAGTGFDVCVLDYAEKAKKFVRGLLPYLWGVICTIFKYRARTIRVNLDGDEIEKKMLVICMANGRFLGGGIPIAPMAQPDDGLLTVVTIDDLPNWRMPFQLGKLLAGKVMKIPGAVERACRRVEIACAGMRVNVDGEILPMDSAVVEILPGALTARW